MFVSKDSYMFEMIRTELADAVGADFDFFIDGGGSSFDYFAMTSKLSEEFSVSFAGVRPFGKTGELYEFVKASLNDVGVSV